MNPVRALLTASVFLTLVALAGCSGGGYDLPLQAAKYTVRTDWLVTKIPASVPSRWYAPARPPLWLLGVSPPPVGDPEYQNMRREVTSKTLLDPRKLEPAQRAEVGRALLDLFGTPDEPRVAAKTPAAQEAVRELRLDPATLAHGSALYRRHCSVCHGATGDGKGAAGVSMVPLPRDYRRGLFKYTSSDVPVSQRKPRREDLHLVIQNGLLGTGMPAFSGLGPAQIDAVVSYVTHLALRGEVEATVMRFLLLGQMEEDESVTKALEDALGGNAKEKIPGLLAAWLRSDRNPVPVTPAPAEYRSEAWWASAKKGHDIFHDARQATCASCHVNLGRAAPLTYDEWGTVQQARNLTAGPFRGGARGEDLYYRVYSGINPSGMPEHGPQLRPTAAERQQNADRIWDVVHFIQAISDKRTRKELVQRYDLPIE